MSSNLLRSLNTLFGFPITRKRFYTFMASPCLPWDKLWHIVWNLFSSPLTDGRLVLALDDFINPKVGSKVFGCASIFDHAAKANQSRYPWAQNVVTIGLLKRIKGRWACLPMASFYYLPLKMIEAKSDNAKVSGKLCSFKTKLEQASQMIIRIAQHFAGCSILVVADSWFGNNGLLKPARDVLGLQFQLLSRLRTNNNLFAFPDKRKKGQRGRTRKYGKKLGNVAELATVYRGDAKGYSVFLYGKVRDVLAYEQVLMSKKLKCPIRVVWVYRKTRFVAFFTTDLSLSVEQIIEFYGARWKIEAAFKELKQEIGSLKTQTRNAHAVMNHLQFCMMAMSLVWIYADRLAPNPQRRHKVKGRTSFAFSDVRRIMAEAVLDEDFNRLCPIPEKVAQNSFVAVFLRMVA